MSKLSFDGHLENTISKAKARLTQLYSISNNNYGPPPHIMIRLYKIFVRPLFEYGSIPLITTTDMQLKQIETLQTKYIRYTLNLTFIKNEIALKYANLPTIKTRLKFLAYNYIKKNNSDKNQPIKEFIKTINPLSTGKTPYKIITQNTQPQSHIVQRSTTG